jgi:hypothetical protein
MLTGATASAAVREADCSTRSAARFVAALGAAFRATFPSAGSKPTGQSDGNRSGTTTPSAAKHDAQKKFTDPANDDDDDDDDDDDEDEDEDDADDAASSPPWAGRFSVACHHPAGM